MPRILVDVDVDVDADVDGPWPHKARQDNQQLTWLMTVPQKAK